MANNLGVNLLSISILLAVVILFVFALRATIKQKGKCAYCDKKDSCPFKNKDLCNEKDKI